jgi:hypothetical protein
LPWRLLIDSANPEAPERSLDTGTVIVGFRAAVVLLAVT